MKEVYYLYNKEIYLKNKIGKWLITDIRFNFEKGDYELMLNQPNNAGGITSKIITCKEIGKVIK